MEPIIEKIKQIRKIKNITLKVMAEKTGLTEGYLSKIEHSDSAPPIPTLRRIAAALEFDISYFFLPDGNGWHENPGITIDRGINAMQTRFSGRPQQENEFGYGYEPLALKKKGKNMEPYLFSPDFELAGVVQFSGEAFHYVIKGEVELIYGAEKYRLSEGDSAYFDANIPFQTRSIGPERAMFLCIVYPYKKR